MNEGFDIKFGVGGRSPIKDKTISTNLLTVSAVKAATSTIVGRLFFL